MRFQTSSTCKLDFSLQTIWFFLYLCFHLLLCYLDASIFLRINTFSVTGDRTCGGFDYKCLWDDHLSLLHTSPRSQHGCIELGCCFIFLLKWTATGASHSRFAASLNEHFGCSAIQLPTLSFFENV